MAERGTSVSGSDVHSNGPDGPGNARRPADGQPVGGDSAGGAGAQNGMSAGATFSIEVVCQEIGKLRGVCDALHEALAATLVRVDLLEGQLRALLSLPGAYAVLTGDAL